MCPKEINCVFNFLLWVEIVVVKLVANMWEVHNTYLPWFWEDHKLNGGQKIIYLPVWNVHLDHTPKLRQLMYPLTYVGPCKACQLYNLNNFAYGIINKAWMSFVYPSFHGDEVKAEP